VLEFPLLQEVAALALEHRPSLEMVALLQALEGALPVRLEERVSPKEVVAFAPLLAKRAGGPMEARVSLQAMVAEEVLRPEVPLEILQLLSKVLVPLALQILVFLLQRPALLLLRRLDLHCFLMSALVLIPHYMIQRPVLVCFEEGGFLVLGFVVRLQEFVIRPPAAVFQEVGSLEVFAC